MQDKEIERLIRLEEKRKKKVINLIASENYISHDVSKALGSVFVNKYAEGYPSRRYYGGNEVVDKIERLCQKRALKLFNLSPNKWHVNVQPYSGSPANLAVYCALVPQGGKIMGMSLENGGHLTHGQKVSLTGKIWKQVPYGVDRKTETINYDEVLKIAKKEKPALIIAGATAYSRKIDFKKFREIADAVDAYFMVDMSHIAGLVAGGVHPSPFPYADVVTTTTHKTLRGPRAALIFSRRGGKTAKRRLHSQSITEAVNKIVSTWTLSVQEAIDRAVFPGLQGGPHMNQIAAAAVCLKEAMQSNFKKYIRQLVRNAKVLANELKKKGWRIISDGTDTHLFLVDTFSRGISGKEATERLEKAGIIVNKNTIPFDKRKPMDPSGIRIGTPAVTTQGMKEKEMKLIAGRIDSILRLR
ncbi:MAG: serine hydroxymethyltransferase [Patescibacteria group bacterium]